MAPDIEAVVLELRVAVADPEDDGVYQISKASIRALLDDFDRVQAWSDKFENSLRTLTDELSRLFPEWADD